ncbi:MAG: methyl-accepting chemotaxis protein [Sphingorhabdus sp.]
MTIQRISKVGAAVVAAIFIVGMMLTGSTINNIRFGGPLQVNNQVASDLLADILPPPAYIIEPYLEATSIALSSESLTQGKARLAQQKKAFKDRQEHWKNSALSPEMKKQINVDTFEPANRFWTELDNTFLPAAERGDAEAVKASHARLTKHYNAHRQLIDALVADVSAQFVSLQADANSSLQWAIWQAVIVALLMLISIGTAAWFVGRKIVGPVAETSNAMAAMARGDYNVTIHGGGRNDEIGSMVKSVEFFRESALSKQADEHAQNLVVGELAKGLKALSSGEMDHRIEAAFDERYEALRADFNHAAQELGSIIGQVAASAESVSTGSAEISSASDDLARRTEQQAASLEETAAAMSEVTAAVRETAKSAQNVSTSVSDTHHEATEGGEIVRQAVTAMGDIEHSAQEIAQIINVIDGIAFQTNLLALNAGVEAARAGDAGKGFAVVANEVRALAQRSADAAKDIKNLITQSTSQVERGVSLVDKTGEMLGRIVEKVGEINALASEISSSAEMQASSLNQINVAVSDMDKMTQQNAAMVEESTAAARSLASEANQLAELVAHFTATKAAGPKSKAKPVGVRKMAAPRVSGNLALKAVPSSEDWTEF